jgi:hypothetical protein
MKKAKSKKKAKANKKSQGTKKAQGATKTQGKKKSQPKKKAQSTKKALKKKKVGGAYPPIVVCQSGTIGQTEGEITFINNNLVSCTITSCTVPCWPAPPAADPVVPAAQNGVAGEKTVALLCLPPVGTYSYTADCCSGGTPPTIKVQ